MFFEKIPLKFSNNAYCFYLTKMLKQNASIMYKSLILACRYLCLLLISCIYFPLFAEIYNT